MDCGEVRRGRAFSCEQFMRCAFGCHLKNLLWPHHIVLGIIKIQTLPI
jgi:hypothetical protein